MAFNTEAEMCAHLVRWLEENGWDVYQEAYSDIDAVKDGEIWSIEAKLQLNPKVISQAQRNMKTWSFFPNSRPNYAYVAVPQTTRITPVRTERMSLLRKMGIGMFTISSDGKVRHEIEAVRWEGQSDIHKRLQPHHKWYRAAGTPGGKEFTPFRRTEALARVILERHGPQTIRELVVLMNGRYHWKGGPKAVRDGFRNMLDNISKWFTCTKHGNAWVYRVRENAEPMDPRLLELVDPAAKRDEEDRLRKEAADDKARLLEEKPGECALQGKTALPCKGEFIPSQHACLRHACLFDYWICEKRGYRIYNKSEPLAWKRAQFVAWLDQLTESDVRRILESEDG